MTPPRLRPGAAVAALIVTPEGRYLLQHRDDRPDIFFPSAWGCFGGAIDAGESPAEALRRELREELALADPQAEPFCTLGMDFSFAGIGPCPRHFFTVPVSEADLAAMRLGEGQAMGRFTGAEALAMPGIVPYDALAIWQHMERERFVA